jgi:D-sedoheptulose 7-phosphate isomerase
MTSFNDSLHRAIEVFHSLSALEERVQTAARWCIDALRSGNKILICGNGGSAAEAQHLAGELLGHYLQDRMPLPAIALTADSVLVTCIANDYSYDDIFARQVRGLARSGDVLICFSTSGNSRNIVAALNTARDVSVRSIAFLGRTGGKAADLADCPLIVATNETARSQEAHQFLLHCMMDRIEETFTLYGEGDSASSCSNPQR